jgi:uridylate kinase
VVHTPYRRIVLKLSGEVLGGRERAVLDIDFAGAVLAQIKAVVALGVEVGVVVGGGNILRGSEAAKRGLGRVAADSIGMLGTVVNGVALKDLARGLGLDLRVMSCIPVSTFAEPYSVDGALAHLKAGRPVVFVGGTGNPFLTTDTAAALRAAEIGADAILKATKVDGVYTADPVRDPRARRFETITFEDAIAQGLGFMDRAALCLCSGAQIPVVVFDIFEEKSIERVVRGERIGTVVMGVSHGREDSH